MSSIPEEKTSTTGNGIAVVMVPLPAQGHLHPLLQLSAHLTNHGIDVHYIGSATHNRQARHRTHRGFHSLIASSSHRLHFHDLPFPSIPSAPPTVNPLLAFPSHLQPSFDAAAAHLIPHLSSLLLSLAPSHRRIALLLDSSMPFAATTASLIPNVEIFVFYPCSAISSLFFLQQSLGKLDENPILPGLHTRVSIHDCISDVFLEFLFSQMRSQTAVIAGRIMNTSHAIEGAILDQLAEEWKVERVFAVSPLIPVTAVDGEHHEDECVHWLDQQPTASVIYVSFGTTSSLSSEQLRELAAGLAASDQRFLWVLRDADRCDVFAAGPDARHVNQEAWTEQEEILKRSVN
ncbi:hypothetical protein HPP92_005004 [Vanilla planifolia]|uniref:Glycosyltransferase N-terminal domain-containing protein n=1 Tax=Vanilla planifolia TaxID=51239 RepID=A0A835VCT2_VANPL|nr:hypothetical protein HPP92_005004 [Vanilla planifolia]